MSFSDTSVYGVLGLSFETLLERLSFCTISGKVCN